MGTIELAGETYERADALKTRLGIADATLWRMTSEGMPSPVRIGRWRFYPRKEIDAWFLERRAN
jgi:predicted DNA-binding transcriptional regulator AlpA